MYALNIWHKKNWSNNKLNKVTTGIKVKKIKEWIIPMERQQHSKFIGQNSAEIYDQNININNELTDIECNT